jgi:MoaA/NifB/PqqE/SkfB family radical SAM enzyme
MVHKPLGLLAELTHHYPLGCPYCSSPLALDSREDELDTTTWPRVFREATQLGVLQVHSSGGEPGERCEGRCVETHHGNDDWNLAWAYLRHSESGREEPSIIGGTGSAIDSALTF